MGTIRKLLGNYYTLRRRSFEQPQDHHGKWNHAQI